MNAEQVSTTESSALVTQEQRRLEIEAAREAGTVEDKLLTLDLIREVGTLDGGKLQRWVVRVPLYPRHQYLIPGARRNRKERGSRGPDDWVGEYSAGIRAEGYDKLNKVAGIRFFTPETVHDRDGREVPNPIHARDYLYHREIGQGYSETGQMILYVEDIEIDFRAAWEAERLKKLQSLLKTASRAASSSNEDPYDDMMDPGPAAAPAPVAGPVEDKYLLRDENGMPRMAENGGLLFRLPEKMEADAMQRISTLRNFGGRQARTICRRRILQQAFALRTLWTREEPHRPELSTQYVWVTGWRDQLTTDEALEKARSEAKQVFGAPIGTYESKPLDDRELDEADELIDGEMREVEEPVVETQVSPVSDEGRTDVKASAAAGMIPGVTVGMPGEKLAKAICGARDVVGPKPCTKQPGHCPSPHASDDGVWPCEASEIG
ncbi:MAG: hypothetical protein ACOYB2_10805 [Limnohabitans sp.]